MLDLVESINFQYSDVDRGVIKQAHAGAGTKALLLQYQTR